MSLITVAAPASISVPASSTTGAYTVTWAASTTAGASYLLQESTSPSFGTFTETAYATNSAAITGKTNGTYYYRVKAVVAGFADSSVVTGANGCLVTLPAAAPASISVPTGSFNGSYSVSWGASPTPGASYVLQESTSSSFTSFTQTAYAGLTAALSGKANGTYYYRVKAVASGYADSVWVDGANGCLVNLQSAVQPSSITVPAFGTGGSFSVSWGASSTSGAVYVLQEATDAAFTQNLVETVGAISPRGYSGKAIGTYYFRVKAIASGYIDSATWTVGANGCVVPSPLAITTASLPGGTVNAAYSLTVQAIGGIPSYTWTATGLPAGLSINPSSGLISGSPDPASVPTGTSATFPVSITVQDLTATTVNTILNLVVNQTLPAAPSGLTATVSGSQVVLNWTDNANNESYFQIQRSTVSNFSTVTPYNVYTAGLSTWTDNNAAPGTTYYYRVFAGNAKGMSSATNAVSVRPIAISNTGLASGSVNVAYSQTMATTGGTAPFTWSASGLPANLTINPATGVISGTPAPGSVPTGTSATFPVSITIVDSASATVSKNFNLLVNQTLPAAPSGLTATVSGTQIVLNWTDNANNETYFQIQRSNVADFSSISPYNVYTADLSTWTDKFASRGVTWYYRVKSGNAKGMSSTFSNTVSAMVP